MAWAIGIFPPHDPGDEEAEPTAWISLYNQRSAMKSYALGWRSSGQAAKRQTKACPVIMGEQLVVYFDEDIPVTGDDDDDGIQADEREAD